MKKNLILAMIVIIFLVNSSLVTGITDYDDNQGSTVDGVIHSNPSAGNKIAITLDVDGSNLDTDLITSLIYNNIPITLFVNTNYLAANKETFLQLKSSHPDLVEFENHGAEHKACILGTEKVYGQEPAGTVEGMTKEIKDAADAIQTALGVTTKYYRPGTGAADAACVETVKGLGHSVVDWSVNGDHGASDTAENVKANWLSVTSGGIIISHLNKPQGNTYEGAKEAISLLKKKGFIFVKLEELLGYTSSVTGTAASALPSKGASLSAEVSESIFTLDFYDKPTYNLQFKYNETKNQWLVSAVCISKQNVGVPLEESPDFVSIFDFFYGCTGNGINEKTIAKIFSGVETFEEGKEALCLYYAEDFIEQPLGASLLVNGEKILLPVVIGENDDELKLQIKDSCLDQIYMTAEGSIAPEIEADEIFKEDEEEQATFSSIISSVASCSECKEIDLVWKDVGKLLQISMALAEKVWQGTAGWLDFNMVYAPVSPASTSGVKTSEKDMTNLKEIYEKYKSAIDAASVQYSIDKSLLVAFIYVESKGKQYALSCSGAGGVMQFLGSTAKGYNLYVPDYVKVDVVLAPDTKCEGKTAGETMTVPCCSSRVPKEQQCCAYQSDERFNPSKAIPAAAKYLKSMKDLSLENKKKKDPSSWIISNDPASEESKLKFAIFHYRGGWSRPGVQENYYTILMNKKTAGEQAGIK